MKREDFNKGWIYDGATVTLPHDAMIATPRDPKSPGWGANGYFTGGIYKYEKTFTVPTEWKYKHIMLQFEGVYQDARVFLNDREIGGAVYGYTPFFVTLDDELIYGAENHLRVVADNSKLPNSRWYTGGGIYRPVWLWIGEKEYIEPEEVRISTVSYAPPQISITVKHTGKNAKAEIFDGEQCIAKTDVPNGCLELPGATLWDEDTPKLYTCLVTLDSGDVSLVRFGIRKIEWDKNGLYINGKNTLLRGGCVHHDNGIVGAVTYDESEYRRVKKLKEAGYNAIRSAHNPCSRAMLDACDELGVYMMDEGWDMWFYHKSKYDYASSWREHHLSDLKAMVERDHNHPSVIMYSIGNEVSEPAKAEGVQATKEMVDYLHELDPSRPVTGGFNLMIISSAKKGRGIYDEENGGRKDDSDSRVQGMNSTLFNMITNIVGTGMNNAANSKKADMASSPSLDLLDLAGYNYASGRYPLEGKAHPGRIIFGSETFPQDIAKNWAMVKKYPYLIGDFMWTAWDYLGEAGVGAWAYTQDGKSFNKPYPWLLADVGAFDILGNPGAPVALARAAWGLDSEPWIGTQPVNHPGVKPAKAVWRGSNAIDSWSWSGCEGNKAIIEVYSSSPFVEVFLNGRSLGKRKTKLCKAIYKTRYEAGNIEAVSYDLAENKIGFRKLVSADKDRKLSFKVEKYNDIFYVNVLITDAHGIVESNADEVLTVSVENGSLLGFGSANPRTEESYQSGSFKTYYGRALAIVRGVGSKLKISGKTLKSAEIVLK